ARRGREPRGPLRALAAFDRVHLAPGESMNVELKLPPEAFASINEKGGREYHPGSYDVSIGGGQPLARVAATSDFVLGRVELRPGSSAAAVAPAP
ncbi:MAG TPA: fibronectin type III-like domain-contianing protein, partial [Polyangiaceae bacterium]|nr:fibronectin type III-like domain-contianing protein [Polyangiaceae bacterium]